MKRQSFIVIGVIFLGMLQYRLWFGHGGIVSNWHLQTQLAEEQAASTKFQSRNLRLAGDIKRQKAGDSGFIEAHARRDLGMIKQGEVFYQLVY